MYKDMFNKDNVPKLVIDAVSELTKYIWKESEEEKQLAITKFCMDVCKFYNMELPLIKIVPELNMYGTALPNQNIIILSNYSLVTFLHEFRHLMQHKLPIIQFAPAITNMTTTETFLVDLEHNMEEDARGFSVSLFYMVAEEKYNKAIEKGTLAYH